MAGAEIKGPVVIYDFDHYYMGSCLAEILRHQGKEVLIVTPANAISAWTFMNNESNDIRMRMIELDVGMVLEHHLTHFDDATAQLTSIYRHSDVTSIDCASLIIVRLRSRNDRLFQELHSDLDRMADAGIKSLQSIGDCRAPGTIAHAVYAGHECARNMGTNDVSQPFALERPIISSLS